MQRVPFTFSHRRNPTPVNAAREYLLNELEKTMEGLGLEKYRLPFVSLSALLAQPFLLQSSSYPQTTCPCTAVHPSTIAATSSSPPTSSAFRLSLLCTHGYKTIVSATRSYLSIPSTRSHLLHVKADGASPVGRSPHHFLNSRQGPQPPPPLHYRPLSPQILPGFSVYFGEEEGSSLRWQRS